MRNMILLASIALITLVCPSLVRADIIKSATLLGSNERPNPNNATAFGSGYVILNEAETAFTVHEEYTGLTGPVTGAHIHVGPVNGTGPVIFDFGNIGFPTGTSGTFDAIITSANLIPRPAAGINTFADAVTAFKQDRLYLNIHTATFPGGEIRGQLVTAPEPGTFALLLLGGSGLALARTWRKRKAIG